MYEGNTEYYEWQTRAERTGTLDKAAREYHRGNPDLYRAVVDGEALTFPVYTTDGWYGATTDVEDPFTVYDPTVTDCNADRAVVQERVNRMATAQNQPVPADIDDYIFNGDGLRMTPLSLTDPKFCITNTDYFTKLTWGEYIYGELAEALYTTGIPADASQKTIANVIGEVRLPRRRQVLESLQTAASVAWPWIPQFGMNATLVFNTGDGYVLVLAKRSESVALYPGRWGAVPAGSYQLVDGEASFDKFLLMEYGEEVFGAPEDGSIAEVPAVRAFAECRADGTAHIDYTGLLLSLTEPGFDMSALIFVDDPEYYQRYIAGELTGNYEATDLREIPLSDGTAMRETFDIESTVPVHGASRHVSLRYLRDVYGVSSALSLGTEPN